MMRNDPIQLLTLAAACGDVAYLRLPRFPAYLLNHPDLVWDVFTTRSRDVRKGPTIEASRRLLGDGLLTSEGEIHRRQRRLLQPIFHRERVEAHAAAMVELAERAAGEWRDGERLDMHREMGRLTLAIVARTLFGADVSAADARAIGEALTEVLAQFDRVFSPFLPITERLPVPSTRRFNRAKGVFDSTIRRMIEERRQSGVEGTDVLSLLLRARDEGAGMSDEQVRDEAITLFLAGHETTSNALTWTWYLLSKHPEAEARLHDELDRELAGRAPAVADLPRLRFTEMVLSESMRLYPPAWAIGRRAISAIPAGEWTIPRGSVLIVSPWLLHHDERWFSDPWAFRPERWEEAGAHGSRHAFIPFGGGPRMCIGEEFARTESRLVIASLARRWSFEFDSQQRVALQPVMTLRPKYGMRMLPRLRVA